MVDSITEEDLNRTESYIDMDEIKDRFDYERVFENKFGFNPDLKERLWERRVWQQTVSQYKGVRRGWTEGEEQFLKENINKRPIWLAKHFPTPRTYQSIYHKRRRLMK